MYIIEITVYAIEPVEAGFQSMLTIPYIGQGPELQCLLRVKADLI